MRTLSRERPATVVTQECTARVHQKRARVTAHVCANAPQSHGVFGLARVLSH